MPRLTPTSSYGDASSAYMPQGMREALMAFQQQYQKKQQPQQSSKTGDVAGLAAAAEGGNLLGGGSGLAATAAENAAWNANAGLASQAAWNAGADAATGTQVGLGAEGSTMAAAAPYLALAAPLAIAYSQGTFKKGHGDLGNNRNRYLDYQIKGYADKTPDQQKAIMDAGTKAGVIYSNPNEIDKKNPLAAQGREMPHVNWQKYLQQGDPFTNLSRGIGGVSDTNSRWRNGLGNPTEDDINNASWLKPEKRTELLGLLKTMNEPKPTVAGGLAAPSNDKIGGSMSNASPMQRAMTRSPGIDLKGNRINYNRK